MILPNIFSATQNLDEKNLGVEKSLQAPFLNINFHQTNTLKFYLVKLPALTSWEN